MLAQSREVFLAHAMGLVMSETWFVMATERFADQRDGGSFDPIVAHL